MIQLRGITKTYNMGGETIYALHNVDLDIQEGEFVAVMGPSGSGKSTLANVIGGLDVPDRGDVSVGDQLLASAKDVALSQYRNKKIGFIFQTFNLQDHLTALENVMLPLVLAKMKPRERKKRAKKCLEIVGLGNRLAHRPAQLSGGQRQRVAIARAIANEPEILIADEPTGNLDSVKGEEILALLKKLNTEKGMTLMIITHDQTLANQADRILTLHDGVLKN